MAVYLYCPRLHQLAASTRLQVDQTCSVGYTLSHILIWRSFKDLNQSDTSVMDAIGKRFEGLLPSHGGTQKWAIILLFLFSASIFDIEGHLQWRHPALGKWWGFNHLNLSWNLGLKLNPTYPLDSGIKLKYISPFSIRFLRRRATCPLHCHGRWCFCFV